MVALDALHLRQLRIAMFIAFGSPLGVRHFWGRHREGTDGFPFARVGGWLNVVNIKDPVPWQRGIGNRFPTAVDAFIAVGSRYSGTDGFHDAATYVACAPVVATVIDQVGHRDLGGPTRWIHACGQPASLPVSLRQACAMAERHDPSRWQSSGQAPWSVNDQAFHPDIPGPGGPPNNLSPQPDRGFSLIEISQLGIELDGAVVAEVTYQLAGIIDQHSITGRRLPPLSEESATLHADGGVSWGLADTGDRSLDVAQALGDLLAMARRLIDGQVVAPALARLFLSAPADPTAIRQCLAASADRHLVVSVVAQAVARTAGSPEESNLTVKVAAGRESTTSPSPAMSSKVAGEREQLRSPRAHRSSAQARVELGSTGGDSNRARLIESLRGFSSPRRLVMLAVGVVVAVVGFGALVQGTPNEVEAAGATPNTAPAATDTASSGVPESGSLRPSVDWKMIVAALDSIRNEAFQTGDRTLLDAVNAADSPALAADRQRLGKLTASGLRAGGLATEVTRVDVQLLRPDQVTLVVADRRPAYRLVSAATGATVSKVRDRVELRWRVRLTRPGPPASTETSGWRVYSVDAA